MAADHRLARAREARSTYEADLLRRPNVVGVGIGSRGGAVDRDAEPVIVVSVSVREPGDLARSGAGLPRELDGVPVEVRFVGDLVAIGMLATRVRAANTGGLMQRRKGDIAAAIQAYAAALERHPDHPETHQNMAVALLLGGDIDGARKGFRVAIALLEDQGRPEAAQALYKQVQGMVKLDEVGA